MWVCLGPVPMMTGVQQRNNKMMECGQAYKWFFCVSVQERKLSRERTPMKQ